MLLQVMFGNSFILMSHSGKFRDSRSHFEKIWSFFFPFFPGFLPFREVEIKKRS